MPIKIDMEMPESCDECPARDEEYGACVFFELRGHEDWCSNFMRPDSCPLKEADDDENHEDLAKEVERAREEYRRLQALNANLMKQMMSLWATIEKLEKKLHDVGASPFDAQIGRK